MAVETYYCPFCGGEIQIEDNMTISRCPHCGQTVGMDEPEVKNEPVKEETVPQQQAAPVQGRNRQFITSEGVVVGTAYVPDDYEITSEYEALWRSEMVPIYYTMKATRNDHRIFMSMYSKEMFNDMKSMMIKGMLNLSDAHVKNGYQKFIEPDVYLIQEANKIAGVPLKVTAKAKLPSPLGRNPEVARRLLDNDIYNFGVLIEVQPEKISECVDSVVYRFSGQLNGKDVVVFTGMDYQGAELVYSKLAFSGLFAKKNNTRQGQSFGHSAGRVDHIMYGPQYLYFCMCYADAEQEAQRDFLNFINSINPDPSLKDRENAMFRRKFEIISAQIARNNAIANSNRINAQINQQRLNQTLQNNANAMSDMIMDSWNQKMASDSRISQARSEATMGVNTYTNSYGQNVDVSVVADHVYQNRYGDVYGVSGNELDQDVLNRLDWTKLDR